MQTSRWNRASLLLFTVPSALALSVAHRMYSRWQFGGEWSPVDFDIIWLGTIATLTLGAIVAAAATLYDAVRRKPLQPMGAFNYALFLYVSIMFGAVTLVTVLETVRPTNAG